MRLYRRIADRKQFFRVLSTTKRSQVATMVLPPGQSSGPYGNDHPASEQVVYVAEGEGVAIVAGHRRRLAGGDVLVIRAGERHQITNTGRRLLRTLSVYAPPAY
jgi:mannose-6-phosphate isomerase-like protein (cupin superfamily)